MIVGLIVAPLVYALTTGSWAPMDITTGTVVLIVAGLLAGFGSVWGNGCTGFVGCRGFGPVNSGSWRFLITRHVM